MHLTSFILTHCVLTLDPPLMTVSSFPVCHCAVTSIISSKKCFLDVCVVFFFFRLVLAEAAVSFFPRSWVTLWPAPAPRLAVDSLQGCH